jgi:RNA polymerase sigma factor (sigma-70 family)
VAAPNLQGAIRHLRRLACGLHDSGDSDQDLLARFRDRHDEAAFETLVYRHGPMVHDVCRRLLGQDADDAFQAVFLILVRRSHSIRKRQSLAGWLYGVAYRTAQRVRRDAARRRTRERRRPAHSSPANPVHEAAWREMCALLDAELYRLPERYRDPLVLCYLEGSTRDRAARQLRWSLRTLDRRLERGRDLMRRRLARTGLSISATMLALGLGQSAARALPAPLARAAVAAATGNGISVAAAALARPALMGSFLKYAIALTFVASLVGAGAGALGRVSPDSAPIENSSAPPADESSERRPITDAHGDPLPDGALARLGTVRLNHGQRLNSVLFLPDNKTILSEGGGVARLWDATGRELQHFSSPKEFDTQVVLHPDGKSVTFLSQGESSDDLVRIWDLAANKTVRTLNFAARRKGRSIYVLNTLSPDGLLAALFTQDGVRVFDIASRREHYQISNAHGVRAAIFAGGNRLLTLENKEGTGIWDTKPNDMAKAIDRICVREASTGKMIRQFSHSDRVEAMAAAPNGRWFALLQHTWSHFALPSGKTLKLHDRDVIHVWNLETGQKRTLKPRPHLWHIKLCFAPDGQRLFAAHVAEQEQEYYGVTVWDTKKGSKIRELQGACGRFMAVSRDGARLVEADSSKLYIWDVDKGRRLAHEGEQHSAGETAFFATTPGRAITFGYSALHEWDIATGKHVATLSVPPYPYRDPSRSHFVSSGGRLAATLHEHQGQLQIHVWDVSARKRLHILRPGIQFPYVPDVVQNATRVFDAPEATCAFSPDAGLLVACISGKETRVMLWDLRNGHQLRTTNVGKFGWPPSVFFTLDGKTLYVAGNVGGQIQALDPSTGKTQFSWNLRTAILGEGGKVDLLPGVTQMEAWRSVAISPDGRVMACILSGGILGMGGSRGRLALLDARSGALLRRFSDSDRSSFDFEHISFSPDARLLASTDGNVIHIWEVATGKEIRTFRGHLAPVIHVAFDRDSRRLISASRDSTALIWDVFSGWGSAKDLTDSALDACWSDLAGLEAARAYRAIATMSSARQRAVVFLRRRLHPPPPPDPQRLTGLITDLDSPTFAVREKASREIDRLGELAQPAIRRELARTTSLEVRRRLQRLLQKIDDPAPRPEPLRQSRALAVLEKIGTAEARQVLQDLARGAPEASLTRQAAQALMRLDHRSR